MINNVQNGVTIIGDQRMLNSMIQDCITNSIKFTPNKGLKSIQSTKMKKAVEVESKDIGVGIGPEKISKLFKESEDSRSEGTNAEKGTGFTTFKGVY